MVSKFREEGDRKSITGIDLVGRDAGEIAEEESKGMELAYVLSKSKIFKLIFETLKGAFFILNDDCYLEGAFH